MAAEERIKPLISSPPITDLAGLVARAKSRSDVRIGAGNCDQFAHWLSEQTPLVRYKAASKFEFMGIPVVIDDRIPPDRVVITDGINVVGIFNIGDQA